MSRGSFVFGVREAASSLAVLAGATGLRRSRCRRSHQRGGSGAPRAFDLPGVHAISGRSCPLANAISRLFPLRTVALRGRSPLPPATKAHKRARRRARVPPRLHLARRGSARVVRRAVRIARPPRARNLVVSGPGRVQRVPRLRATRRPFRRVVRAPLRRLRSSLFTMAMGRSCSPSRSITRSTR